MVVVSGCCLIQKDTVTHCLALDVLVLTRLAGRATTSSSSSSSSSNYESSRSVVNISTTESNLTRFSRVTAVFTTDGVPGAPTHSKSLREFVRAGIITGKGYMSAQSVDYFDRLESLPFFIAASGSTTF